MRVAEGRLVTTLREFNANLQNSYSDSFPGAGFDAAKPGVMIDLYLLTDYFDGECS